LSRLDVTRSFGYKDGNAIIPLNPVVTVVLRESAMRTVFLVVMLTFAGCSNSTKVGGLSDIAVRQYVDSPFARRLAILISKIERGDLASWQEFASYAYRLDGGGEYAETYGVACAELARHDPTLFLRSYLAGDDDALFCGWSAHHWSSQVARRRMAAICAQRLATASDAGERRKIKDFVSETATEWPLRNGLLETRLRRTGSKRETRDQAAFPDK